MLSSVHLDILRRAAACELPAVIGVQSGVDLVAFGRLWRSGLVDAVDAGASDGDCYLNPAITLAGLGFLTADLAKAGLPG